MANDGDDSSATTLGWTEQQGNDDDDYHSALLIETQDEYSSGDEEEDANDNNNNGRHHDGTKAKKKSSLTTYHANAKSNNSNSMSSQQHQQQQYGKRGGISSNSNARRAFSPPSHCTKPLPPSPVLSPATQTLNALSQQTTDDLRYDMSNLERDAQEAAETIRLQQQQQQQQQQQKSRDDASGRQRPTSLSLLEQTNSRGASLMRTKAANEPCAKKASTSAEFISPENATRMSAVSSTISGGAVTAITDQPKMIRSNPDGKGQRNHTIPAEAAEPDTASTSITIRKEVYEQGIVDQNHYRILEFTIYSTESLGATINSLVPPAELSPCVTLHFCKVKEVEQNKVADRVGIEAGDWFCYYTTDSDATGTRVARLRTYKEVVTQVRSKQRPLDLFIARRRIHLPEMASHHDNVKNESSALQHRKLSRVDNFLMGEEIEQVVQNVVEQSQQQQRQLEARPRTTKAHAKKQQDQATQGVSPKPRPKKKKAQTSSAAKHQNTERLRKDRRSRTPRAFIDSDDDDEERGKRQVIVLPERAAIVPFCGLCAALQSGKKKTNKRQVHHALCPKHPCFTTSNSDNILKGIIRGVNAGCPTCWDQYQLGKHAKHDAHASFCPSKKRPKIEPATSTNHKKLCGANSQTTTLTEIQARAKATPRDQNTSPKDDAPGRRHEQIEGGEEDTRTRGADSLQRSEKRGACNNGQNEGGAPSVEVPSTKRQLSTSDPKPSMGSTISGQNCEPPSKRAKTSKSVTISEPPTNEESHVAPTPKPAGAGVAHNAKENNGEPIRGAWNQCHNPWGCDGYIEGDVVLLTSAQGLGHHETLLPSKRYESQPFSGSAKYAKTHATPEEGFHMIRLHRDPLAKRAWGFTVRHHEFGGACLVELVDPLSPAEAATFVAGTTANAGREAALRTNDMIIAVNDKDVGGLTQVGLDLELEICGPRLTLVVSRYKYANQIRDRIAEAESSVLGAIDHAMNDERQLGWIDVGAKATSSVSLTPIIKKSVDEHLLIETPKLAMEQGPVLTAATGEMATIAKESATRRVEDVNHDSDQAYPASKNLLNGATADELQVSQNNSSQNSPGLQRLPRNRQNLNSVPQSVRENTHDELPQSRWCDRGALRETGVQSRAPQNLRQQAGELTLSDSREQHSVTARHDTSTMDRSDCTGRGEESNVLQKMKRTGYDADDYVEHSASTGYSSHQEFGKEHLKPADENGTDEGDVEDDGNPVCGCVCGPIHEGENGPEFWIQCDSCQAWYSAATKCIGFTEEVVESLEKWSCWACESKIESDLEGGISPTKRSRCSGGQDVSSIDALLGYKGKCKRRSATTRTPSERKRRSSQSSQDTLGSSPSMRSQRSQTSESPAGDDEENPDARVELPLGTNVEVDREISHDYGGTGIVVSSRLDDSGDRYYDVKYTIHRYTERNIPADGVRRKNL